MEDLCLEVKHVHLTVGIGREPKNCRKNAIISGENRRVITKSSKSRKHWRNLHPKANLPHRYTRSPTRENNVIIPTLQHTTGFRLPRRETILTILFLASWGAIWTYQRQQYIEQQPSLHTHQHQHQHQSHHSSEEHHKMDMPMQMTFFWATGNVTIVFNKWDTPTHVIIAFYICWPLDAEFDHINR